MMVVQLGFSLFGIGGGFDGLTAWAQRAHQKVAHTGFIVDDQDCSLRQPRPEFWSTLAMGKTAARLFHILRRIEFRVIRHIDVSPYQCFFIA